MNSFRGKAVLFGALLLLVAGAVFAQTTGRLTGTVIHEGSPLPGVMVTISSPNLQGTRTTYTDVNGNYTFGAVPPGRYTVVFDMEGMQQVSRMVDVSVAGTATANATLRLSAIAEAITVTASAPSVVATQEVQTSISADLIEDLPIGRTIIGTVQLAPGVTNSGVGGATVISGAPAYDSTYYIDGAVVNEVLRGQPLDLFIEDALEETTVQTGAISAEFGRFTGGVVTAVTKAGGNEFSGSIRTSLTDPRWTETSPLGEARAESDLNETYEATFGGRIIRDRLWFFTAGRYFETESPRSFYRATDLPEDMRTYTFGREQRRLEGKLTGQITQRHTLVGSYLDLQDEQLNNAFGAIWEPSAIDEQRETPQYKLSAQYNGIITNNFLIEALYTESELRFVDSGGPIGDFANATNVYNWNTGTYLGAPTFASNLGDITRGTDDLLLKGTYYLATRGLGTHNIVVGYDDFTNSVVENNTQSGSDFTIWTFNTPTRTPQGVTTPIFAPGDWIIWFPILQASQGSDFNTRSFFVNDRWDFNQNLSFNLGARYDRNKAVNQEGNLVGDDESISPRLGATYDLRGDGRLRINASYGKYASKIASGNVGEATSAAGSPSYVLFGYYGPAITGLPTRQGLQQVWNWFQSVGGIQNTEFVLGGGTAGIETQLRDRLVTPNADEWTIGFSSALGRGGYVRLDYQNREWHDFYSTSMTLDAPFQFDPLAGYDIQVTFLENTNDFERTYEAVLVQGGYRLFDRLNIGANYTWSESRGNIVGESAGGGPGAVTGFNYKPELLNYDRRNPVGFLGNDQTHKVRVWTSYDQPTPIGNFNLSLLGRFDSGTPYSYLGLIDVHRRGTAGGNNACPQCPANPGYQFTPTGNSYFFSDRGQFRWDDVLALDVGLNYSLPIGPVQLFIQGEVRNVTNEQAQTGGDTTILTARNAACTQTAAGPNPGARCLAFNPFTETPVEGVHWRTGPNFGNPTTATTFFQGGSFQLPRTYLVSGGIRF
jgi:hypothetical protein